jgi:hypothetical protein
MIDPMPSRTRSRGVSQTSRTPASLTLLMEEYFVRLKILAYEKYFGRSVFIVLLGAEQFLPNARSIAVQITIAVIAIATGTFWYAGRFTQEDAMRRLAQAVADVESESAIRANDKRGHEKWDTAYIRFHYERMYTLDPLSVIFKFEPFIWSMMTLIIV